MRSFEASGTPIGARTTRRGARRTTHDVEDAPGASIARQALGLLHHGRAPRLRPLWSRLLYGGAARMSRMIEALAFSTIGALIGTARPSLPRKSPCASATRCARPTR